MLLNVDAELMDDSVATRLKMLKVLFVAGMMAPRQLNKDGSLQTNYFQALPSLEPGLGL